MLQEIITYMIIGSAVTIAVMKTIKKFSKKKKKKINFQNENFKMEHNCSDCSAECILRNAVKPSVLLKEDESLCKKVEIKSN